MARLRTVGFEVGLIANGDVAASQIDARTVSLTQIPTIDTGIFRTGSSSCKCPGAAGGSGAAFISVAFTGALATDYYARAYVYMDALPTSFINILSFVGTSGLTQASVQLNTNGTVALADRSGIPLGAASKTALSLNKWYRLELHVKVPSAGNGTGEISLDGTVISSSTNVSEGNLAPAEIYIGWPSTPGVTANMWIDDVAINDGTGVNQNSWPGAGSVVLLKAISDNQVGSWAAGGGGASSLFSAISNTPPVGLSAETNTSQIKRLAQDTAGTEYRANLTTYSTAGIGERDYITLVHPVWNDGEEIATGTKSGAVALVSNPVSSGTTTFNYGDDNGALGTWPTGWRTHWGDTNSIVYDPQTALGTSPVIKISKTDAGTAEGDVDFLGVYAEYIPNGVTLRFAATTPSRLLHPGKGVSSISRFLTGPRDTLLQAPARYCLPIRYRGGAGQAGASSTTLALNVPAGTINGDLMIVTIAQGSGAVITPPAGWNQIVLTGNSNAGMWWRIADNEPASYTWNGAAQTWSAITDVFFNTDQVNPLDVSGNSLANQSTSAVKWPTLQTVTGGAWVLAVSRQNGGTDTIAVPTGYTSGQSVAPGNGFMRSSTKLISQTASESPTSTDTGTPDWTVFDVAIRPWCGVLGLAGLGTIPIVMHPGRGPVAAARFFETRRDTTVSVTTVTQNPFSLSDWPVPSPETFAMQLRSFTDPLKQWLTGLDAFFGDPGVGPDYDYPNPRGAAYPSDLRTFFNQLEIQLIGQDIFFGGIGQAVANLDWPVPKGKEFASSLRTFIENLKINLTGLDTFFGPSGMGPDYDYPNPRGKDPTHLRTFIDQFKWALQGLDTFFGGQGQAPANLDWPVPRGYVPDIVLRTWVDPLKIWLKGLDTFFGAAGQAVANLDWPVPKGKEFASSLRTWLQTLVATTLVAADSLPFRLGDWPNPRGYIPSIDLRTWLSNLVNNTLQVILFPFFLLDWPNPRGYVPVIDLKTWLDPLKQWLVGLDALPFSLGDWPNPRGYVPGISLRTWLDSLKQWLVGLDLLPFRLTDWPNPLRVRDFGWVRGFTDWFKLALVGQDFLPFGLADWPVPKGYVPASELRTWLLGLVNTVLFVIIYPFNLLDWPNPRGYIPVVSLKTWLDPLKIWLTGLDTFFGAAGQAVANLDWPVPKGRIPSIDLRTWTNPLKIWLTGLDMLPFSLGDWPNPIRIRDEKHIRGFIDAMKILLIGQDTFFGAIGQGIANLDWPVPKGKEFASSLRTWLNAMQQQLFGKDFLPFSLSDWPVPKVRLPSVDLKTFIDPLKAWLAGLDVLPFNLTDWPVPKVRPPGIDLKTWWMNLQQTTLFQFINPFFMLDWPNPRGYVPGIGLRTFIDPLKAWLTGLDLLPFNLEDWPVPKGYIPGIVLKTWTDALKMLLIARDTFFGAQGQGVANLDWPVPKGRIPSVDLRTFVDTLKTNLIGRDFLPFSLSDWPNPIRIKDEKHVRGFIDAMKVWLIGLDTFFGGQGQAPANLDWPVPRGRIPSIDLKTWIVSLVETTLFRMDTFFGAAGQGVANLDWPVPKGREFASVLRTWLGAMQQQLFGQDFLPFNLTDWPVPKVRAPSVDLRSWIIDIVRTTLNFLPFSLMDWPVPKGKEFASILRTWLDVVRLNLIGRDFLPFNMTDWPVPKVRAPSIDLRSWVSSIITSAYAILLQPFNLLDWPNPRGYAPTMWRTWLVNFVSNGPFAYNGALLAPINTFTAYIAFMRERMANYANLLRTGGAVVEGLRARTAYYPTLSSTRRYRHQ